MTTYPIGHDTMPYIRGRNNKAATKRRRPGRIARWIIWFVKR